MRIIDSPTERTTAATNVILAVIAFGCLLSITTVGEGWRAAIWVRAFGLLGVAAFLGAIAHGFHMSEKTNRLIWHPLNLALGLTVGLFVTGTINDLWGQMVSAPALWVMLGITALFFIATFFWARGFVGFILYEAGALLFALGGYTWLALTGQLAGAAWIAAGILISIFAAAIQATRKARLHLIWTFDHNGVFHLVQMPGLVLLAIGLRAAFLR